MSLVVRAFPLKGSIPDFEAFVKALQGPRRADAAAFYNQHGITHESWHLQQTDHGPLVIVISMADDPATAAPKYARASDEFASWFKERVLALSGVDPSTTPLGPPTREVYHWSANPQLASTFAAFVQR